MTETQAGDGVEKGHILSGKNILSHLKKHVLEISQVNYPQGHIFSFFTFKVVATTSRFLLKAVLSRLTASGMCKSEDQGRSVVSKR